jgi:hypothetical protein
MSNRAVAAKATKTSPKGIIEQLEDLLTRYGPTGKIVGEPLPERVQQALARGEEVRVSVVRTEKGEDSGHRVWKIVPVLDDLKRRGTINEEEYEAAMRFCRHWVHGAFIGPVSSRFTPKYDGAVGDMHPNERMMHYRKMWRNAWNSVNPILQPALVWLISATEDGRPLEWLGAYYVPQQGLQSQKTKGAAFLQMACVFLCQHYGIDHRLTRKNIESVLQKMVDSRLLAV